MQINGYCDKKMSLKKIRINNLTKYYGKNRGIENLSLEIQQGEIFGFLGPNGAGKTTTIRCLMNILLPSSGTMYINGNQVTRKNPHIREEIGYIPGELVLPENYSVKDFLDYVQSMRKISSPRRDELIKKFGLSTKKKIGELSKGNKQKVAIVAAFMHDPAVLILDEPTSGLDPLLQQEVYELLIDARNRGKTVFFSSHNLGEVQRICDRVGIVKDGKLVSVEDIEDLNQQVPRILEARLQKIIPEKLTLLGDQLISSKDGNIKIIINQTDSINKFLEILLPMKPVELSFPPASLEAYFLKFYATSIEV